MEVCFYFYEIWSCVKVSSFVDGRMLLRLANKG